LCFFKCEKVSIQYSSSSSNRRGQKQKKVEREREREKEDEEGKRGILGGLSGVANEKRRDDHEGYHMPHHPSFTSHLLFSFCLVPFTLALNPNCPSPPPASLDLFFVYIFSLDLTTLYDFSFFLSFSTYINLYAFCTI